MKYSDNAVDSNRLKEANKREQLLKPLHSMERSIKELCSKIGSELRETVTYMGTPYVVKMKTDYIDIVKKCSRLNPNSKDYAKPLSRSHSRQGKGHSPQPKPKKNPGEKAEITYSEPSIPEDQVMSEMISNLNISE